MKKYTGLAGSGGCEVLPAVLLRKEKPASMKRTVSDCAAEIEHFRVVQQAYAAELDELGRKAHEEAGEDAANIFKAYRAIASDDIFFRKPIKRVQEESCSIDWAIETEKEKVCAKIAAMNDPYMKERASDIRNVCEEIIRRLNGTPDAGTGILNIREPFVLVAEDLTPEDTIRLDKTWLRGFLTEKGGITSHAVILAKTLGIPAVVGVTGIMGDIRAGQMIYIDGNEGYGVVDPDEDWINSCRQHKTRQDEQNRIFAAMAGEPAVTVDGHRAAVCVNAGDAGSCEDFAAGSCDGIGLFRTEFLFMNQRDYPDEERQFTAYRQIAASAQGKEVIIRTLDIGGDKQLDYMDIPRESNPFLGYRAIRICLDREAVFLTQLRAILRASVYGQIKIMFPMIVTLEELRAAKAMLEKAKASLRADGLAFAEAIPVGIMIETPAAVLISDKLARESAFFSIGTNDLIQYTTATDRMNEKVQYLYDPCNLSVLRAIATVIRNGHQAGIPVGMCGEAASDERLTPLLLAFGLDEFSVVPAQVGRIKHRIRRCNLSRIQGLAGQVLEADTAEEVKKLLAAAAAEQ